MFQIIEGGIVGETILTTSAKDAGEVCGIGVTHRLSGNSFVGGVVRCGVNYKENFTPHHLVKLVRTNYRFSSRLVRRRRMRMATKLYRVSWQMGNDYYTDEKRATRAWKQLMQQGEDTEITDFPDATKVLKAMDERTAILWQIAKRLRDELKTRHIEIPADVQAMFQSLGDME